MLSENLFAPGYGFCFNGGSPPRGDNRAAGKVLNAPENLLELSNPCSNCDGPVLSKDYDAVKENA